MPLQSNTIENELRKFMDDQHPQFGGFPDQIDEVAEEHSEAMRVYASGIVPVSTAVTAAKNAMKSILLTVTVSAGDFIPKYQSAIAAFASTLGSGMAPAFSATPPSTPIDLSPMVSAGMNGASGGQCAGIMAGIIDTWMRTGTATNNNSGAVTNWN